MSLDRKVRPEAVLKTLPPEQQAAVFTLIESTTYALALPLIEAQWGIKTSEPALCMFRAWYLKRKLRRDMLDSVRIADVLDKKVDGSQLDRAIALKTKDLAWRALLAGHDKKAIKALVELSLDTRVEDRNDAKLKRIMTAEKQRDEALKQLADMEKQVGILLGQLHDRKQGADEGSLSKAMDAMEMFLGTKPKAQPAPTSSNSENKTQPEHAQGVASEPAAAESATEAHAPGQGQAAPDESGSSVTHPGPEEKGIV